MEREERWAAMRQIANASPYYRHSGLEIVELAEGTSLLRLSVKDELKNLYGTLHGGVLMAMLDSTCSFAVGSLLEEGESMVTLDIRVNLISNVSEGMLTGEGTAIHKGRSTAVARGEIRDESGKLIACGMTTNFVKRLDSQTLEQLGGPQESPPQ